MNENNMDFEKKQLLHLRLQTIILMLILLLLIVFTCFLIQKAAVITEIVHQLDVNQLNETIFSLKTAADTLGQLDMETLNKGIGSLSAAAEHLNKVDFDKLTVFMDSLDGLSRQLQGISDFFGAFMK